MPRTALVVTYTMPHPRVVGVFFRGLRLAQELDRRGWRTVILNEGPVIDDPKVRARPASVELLPARPDSTAGAADVGARLRSFAPDVVVFGEGPIAMTQLLFEAARRVPAPFVLLDQYYQGWLLERRDDVDLVLLYGLRPFWTRAELAFDARHRLVPPFIAEVTPRAELPLPEAVRSEPWLTILGLDLRVLHEGIALARDLEGAVVITVSPQPQLAATTMAESGIAAGRAVALGPQSDADLFGLVAGSRAIVLANGFMQIMEALALGCPAVCIDRGVGLPAWSLDRRFKPYVSIGEPPEAQRRRLAGWLRASPFDDDLAAALRAERDGARVAAELIEGVVARAVLSVGAWLRRRRRRRGAPARMARA